MSATIYIDACIYLDYFEGRVDKLRPLGEFAFNIFRRAVECEFTIVVSDLVIFELEKHIKNKDILKELLNKLDNLGKIIKMKRSKQIVAEAKKISQQHHVHIADAFHLAFAKISGAEYLVTRNLKDFPQIYKELKIVLPENI